MSPKPDHEFTEQASVHPDTLTRLSQGELDLPAGLRPKRRGTPWRTVRSQGYELRVHPRVWEIAIGLAERDRSRIEVLSPTEVIVHNTSDWR